MAKDKTIRRQITGSDSDSDSGYCLRGERGGLEGRHFLF